MARGQENVAKVALLFVAVAALNALRRGDLKQWAGAKFLNWNSPAPSGQGTFASTVATSPRRSNGSGEARSPTCTEPPTCAR